MPPHLSVCPVCGAELTVVCYHCQHCDTLIEGHFENSTFPRLSAEQIEFLKTFVRCEGKINRVEQEREWGSYPTIRNRLRALILAMGDEPGNEGVTEPSEDAHEVVLEDVDNGRSSSEVAMRGLSGQKG